MNTGWVKIYRDICNHELWQDKPFSKGQAWLDILLEVNHREKNVLLGNQVIKVKIGEKITSIRKLCERWGWSNTKVKNFLALLETEQMITHKSDTKKTFIKVLNYSEYQQRKNGESDKETSQKHHNNITETTQKHTNKNVKNEKNVKKEEEIPSFIDPSIWKDFVEMRNSKKKPLTERACQQIWNKLKDTDNPNYWLEQSIENCWTTVYPKEEQKSSYVQLWDGSARVPRYLCIKTERGWEEKSRVGEPSHLKGE
jgi:DNA-binding transcriptional regulator YhcF (GntR family)